eukprot:119868-Pelagomonas_calceolata.AAC.1
MLRIWKQRMLSPVAKTACPQTVKISQRLTRSKVDALAKETIPMRNRRKHKHMQRPHSTPFNTPHRGPAPRAHPDSTNRGQDVAAGSGVKPTSIRFGWCGAPWSTSVQEERP